MQDPEFNILFDDFDDTGGDDEDVDGGYSDGVDWGAIYIGSDDDSDELDDGDFLSQLLRHTKAECWLVVLRG